MYCVVDCIQVSSFRSLCKIEFTFCSTVLSINSHLKVFLCAVCYNFTKKFSEFCSMLCFFVSSFFPVKSDFRISFSVSNSCHCKVHSYFRALSCEVCTKICKNIFADTLCNTYNVLSSPYFVSFLLFELRSWCVTDWTFSRCSISFVNITTYCTYKFFHNDNLLFLIDFFYNLRLLNAVTAFPIKQSGT